MSENLPTQNLEKEENTVPIVALGGSAGGLEAISQILQDVSPATGMAFVYIQHLSPTYESHLSDILGRLTTMPVHEASHQMKIEPNKVYIIPPDKDMEIVDGSLILFEREPRPFIHLPIDRFFLSLAEGQKDGAIGIILSGTANDGTIGLKAIKAAGGITFAQDESAKHQSMPQSAIVEGVIDMVLSPQEMAVELERLSEKKTVFKLAVTPVNEPQKELDEETEDEDLKNILTLVKRAVGVDFDHYKVSTIRRRIVRRMLLYKLETLNDYAAYLKIYPNEATILYNDLLINVTNFFRDSDTMEYLKKNLFPQIIKNKNAGDTVRIWIPACSTGQEAYSLAMILLELLGETTAISIQIFASDLSEPAIARARHGLYSAGEVLDVSGERLSRFFIKKDDQFQVKKSIRDLCVFALHNVLRDPPFSRLDLISCRNLLIYLDTVLQQKVIGTFHYALNPEGYLLLGNSEAVGSAVSLFSQIDKKERIYIRKSRDTSKASFDMNLRWRVAGRLGHTGTVNIPSQIDEISIPVRNLDKEVDAMLLKKYVPACVVVDQDLEILQFRGSTGLFLEHAPGKASFNLMKMARPSLLFELRNAIHKSRKSGEVSRKTGLEMKVDDQIHYVKIEVVPLRSPSDQFLFLVVFEEVLPSSMITDQTASFRDDRVKQLEQELSSLRKDMHSIIEDQENSNEELQSANEEIVSSNEELQSINEELETSKEEIESTNEELLTINQELLKRNHQLTEAYGYSEAIFSTIAEATLVLDKELRVKSANAAFYKIFYVPEKNIEGQMFYELDKRQWDIAKLRQLLEEVITNDVHIKSYEVSLHFQGIGEKTMLLHARKVVQHERKEAILLVIEDITEHRHVQRMLEERQAWFHNMIDHAPALIWVTGQDSRINFLNKAMLEFTGHDTCNPEYDFTKYIHEEDRRPYEVACTKNFVEKQIFSIEYRLRRNDGEYRWVLETAKPMFGNDGKFIGYIGNGTEIHLQKTLSDQLNQHVQQRTQELREANDELESSNKEIRKTADRLQSVLNGVPAAITLMEVVENADNTGMPDFVTSVYNHQTLELTGLSAEDFQKDFLLKENPDLKAPDLIELYVQVLKTGNPVYKEIAKQQAAEDHCHAYFITRQIDESGVILTILDISERKGAEMKLIKMMESLQAVLDCSPGSISYLKPVYNEAKEIEDFRLVVSNQKFAREFHKPLSELVDTPAKELYSPEAIEQMKKVLQTGEYFYEEVYVENEKKWLGNSIIRHEHGVVIAGLNITSLKESEQQQIKWIQQLDESNEMIQSLEKMRQYISHRGEFLRATSHDLRGSFGIIMGATALLNLMDTDDQRARSLEMIQRNLRQVTYMMNQLLDYSRLEAGQERLEISLFDVSDMLNELCESLIPMSKDKGLWIRKEGPEQLIIEGDLVKIRRIVQNLLLNSLKYTREGGVHIRWGKAETDQHSGEKTAVHWFIAIEDTGTGMSLSLLSKLNEPSDEVKQVMGQSSASTTGEGIGLFIVKRLCELLGAKLIIESTEGKGTLFYILLPEKYPGQLS